MPGSVQPACVVAEEGRIVHIGAYSASYDYDAGDHFLLPGLVDSHIHINEPGRTDWEGFETATRAAAAGGYTCLVDMPLNSIPATTNIAALETKRAAARSKALVDYAFWGGAVAGNIGDLLPLAKAGVRGFKTFLVPSGVDEFSLLDEAGLREAMPLIAETGLPLLAHAEAPGALHDIIGDPRHYPNYLASRPGAAEVEAIRLLIRLAREYRCRVHIVHLATSQALPDLAQARQEGLPITVETCPHYLYFAAESIPDGATQFKCAPPIRSASHQQRLWQALQSGQIDLIATDHSPCPPNMKAGDFKTAWGGIASVSLALSAIWTKARFHGCTIAEIVRWMSTQSAHLAGLTRKGRIAVGADADFVIFDPAHQWTVTEDHLHFRNKVSPYLGERFTGQVKATFVRGHLVYQDGRFPSSPAGTECTVNKI